MKHNAVNFSWWFPDFAGAGGNQGSSGQAISTTSISTQYLGQAAARRHCGEI
jgi:hypothetical protein